MDGAEIGRGDGADSGCVPNGSGELLGDCAVDAG